MMPAALEVASLTLSVNEQEKPAHCGTDLATTPQAIAESPKQFSKVGVGLTLVLRRIVYVGPPLFPLGTRGQKIFCVGPLGAPYPKYSGALFPSSGSLATSQ